MYCTHCGKEIDENIKFCPYCGSENAFTVEQSKTTEIIGSVKRPTPVITSETFDIKENIFGLVTALMALVSLFLPWVRHHAYWDSKNYNYFKFLKLLKSDDLYFISSDTATLMKAVVILGIIIIAVCHFSNHHVLAFIGDALLLAGVRFGWHFLKVIHEEADYLGSMKLRSGFYVMIVAVIIDVIVTVLVLYQRKRLEN